MTARVTFSCDSCNPEADENASRGVEVTMLGDWPVGWWDVPGFGRDKNAGGGTGHVCPECVLDPAVWPKVLEARSEGLSRLMGETRDG